MAKKLKKGKSIKIEAMLTLLRQVHLGGLIDECSLTIKKGKGTVEAVDITNSLIVIAHGPIATKAVNCLLGLGNLDLLISFFASIPDSQIAMVYKEDNDFCTFKRKDARRKLDYLLTQPDLIATNLSLEEEEDEEDAYAKIDDLIQYSIELTPEVIKDFLKYVGMLTNKEVSICFDGDDELKFHIGSKNDHQFELVLGEEVETLVDEADGETEMVLNGEHLAKVLNTIDYDDEDPPVLKFANNEVPVMIEYEGICWCLNPIADYDEGE